MTKDKVEIKSDGTLTGTEILINGVPMKGVQNITMSMDVKDFVNRVTITTLSTVINYECEMTYTGGEGRGPAETEKQKK